MNRKETTEFLGNLLVKSRFSGMGKYWAREVSIDYGHMKGKEKRVDFMQFIPVGQCSVSSIEKGIFVCYEIKSCKADVYSGNGLNFLGEKNYIVMPMESLKEIQQDVRSGKLYKHIEECNPESTHNFGIMVPVPWTTKPEDEYENPTELNEEIAWELKVIAPCRQVERKRSMIELLFCMMRSGR